MFLRSAATPITLASFLTLAVTGLCLLGGWHRGLVDPVHEAAGVVFVLGGLLHIWVNGRATLAHLRRPAVLAITSVGAAAAVLAVMPIGETGGNPKAVLMKTARVWLGADLDQIAAITHQDREQLARTLGDHGFTLPSRDASLAGIAAASHRNPMEALGILFGSLPSGPRP
jgi:hypothetical protein